jgi:hypothetical protein
MPLRPSALLSPTTTPKEYDAVKPDEIRKLEAFLKKTFPGTALKVKPLPRRNDTAEVYIGEDFAGLIAKDTEEGELSYHFTMTILDIDLE